MSPTPLLVLDRQHAGKRSHPDDMGAQADIDHDGQVEQWEREAELTPIYAAACGAAVQAAGADYQLIDPAGAGLRADYYQRHEQVRGIASHRRGSIAYGACHLNAGGGSYALVGYDRRSRLGKQLALAIGAGLEAVPVISRVYVEPLAGRWAHGRGTISGIYWGPVNLCGVLLEPLFVDHLEHQSYIQDGGLVRVGQAIARGVLDYFDLSSSWMPHA